MQDAFGGLLNIFIILIFIVIVEGILAFTVSYTKAFRMKNFVISVVEQYEGSGCFCDADSACKAKIRAHAEAIHYKPTVLQCNSNTRKVDGLFCVSNAKAKLPSGLNSAENKYYRIVTQVDINLPIVNNIMGLEFFQVSGDTRLINIQNPEDCVGNG